MEIQTLFEPANCRGRVAHATSNTTKREGHVRGGTSIAEPPHNWQNFLERGSGLGIISAVRGQEAEAVQAPCHPVLITQPSTDRKRLFQQRARFGVGPLVA